MKKGCEPSLSYGSTVETEMKKGKEGKGGKGGGGKKC
jgi:hypothetical protein